MGKTIPRFLFLGRDDGASLTLVFSHLIRESQNGSCYDYEVQGVVETSTKFDSECVACLIDSN
jgi:hypothetical protein